MRTNLLFIIIKNTQQDVQLQRFPKVLQCPQRSVPSDDHRHPHAWYGLQRSYDEERQFDGRSVLRSREINVRHTECHLGNDGQQFVYLFLYRRRDWCRKGLADRDASGRWCRVIGARWLATHSQQLVGSMPYRLHRRIRWNRDLVHCMQTRPREASVQFYRRTSRLRHRSDQLQCFES